MDDVSPELLLRTRGGDTEAFGEFYDQTAPDLLQWFRYRSASDETAAELTAETFAEALRSLRSYDPSRGTPGQWLYGIARNLLHRWWRAERVSNNAREALQVQLDYPTEDETDLVAFRADLEALLGPLADALAQLSDGTRDAVFARVVSQLSYREVADELGCSPGAARVRVSRGLSQLQSHLQAVGVHGV